ASRARLIVEVRRRRPRFVAGIHGEEAVADRSGDRDIEDHGPGPRRQLWPPGDAEREHAVGRTHTDVVEVAVVRAETGTRAGFQDAEWPDRNDRGMAGALLGCRG